MTAPDFQVAAVRRLLYPDTGLKRIAYGVPEAADALEVSRRKLWALLRGGQIPALWTGRRWILPGGTVLAILGTEHPDINDHRDPLLLQADRLYTRANLTVLLGVTRPVVRGLVEGGRVEESEAIGSARYSTGATVRAFLGRVDEPLRKSA